MKCTDVNKNIERRERGTVFFMLPGNVDRRLYGQPLS